MEMRDLDYEGIRNSLVEYLKSTNEYKDFNFQASGISTLINTLAHNTHFISYYIKMMLDEGFVESAKTLQAMYALAERNGYLPRGRQSAIIDLKLRIKTTLATEPANRFMVVRRGTSFNSTNIQNDSRTFFTIDDVVIFERMVEGVDVYYTSPLFTIYEGIYDTWRFEVDSTIINQKFVIQDQNVDIDTLVVNVKTEEGIEESQIFNRVTDVFEIDSKSNVYYVTMSPNGFYEIFFGNDVFGRSLQPKNIIECTYISSTGVQGNGSKQLSFNAPPINPLDATSIGNYSNIEIIENTVSSGGAEPQTVDELKFLIPNQFKRQQRVINETDYRSIILDNFRDIQAINVWGGEDNFIKRYGAAFVSIKPRFSDAITAGTKNRIRKQLTDKYGYVGNKVIFVEPEFIDVNMQVFTKVDFRKTDKQAGEIESYVNQKLIEYNNTKLNTFSAILSEVDMLNFVRMGEPAIRTLFSVKHMRKSMMIYHGATTEYVMLFSNPIFTGIKTKPIMYGTNECVLTDHYLDGRLFLLSTATNELLIPKQMGTVDYTEGVIRFSIPEYAKVKGYEKELSGVIQFVVKPTQPDINTFNNNIVRIKEVNTTVTT